MIEFKIRGENIETTDAIIDYINKHIGKIEQYIDTKNNPIAHINIRKYAEKTFKVEATIPLANITLRAEETDIDFYYAVDLVADKLARQIRKYKTKVNKISREHGIKGLDFLENETEPFEENKIEVIKRKSLALKPMSLDEAVLQMELLNHSFFIYRNQDTSELDIVYKRDDGKYGLIETEKLENSK